MSIVETDWGAFLAPDSDIRPDVIFRVEGASDEGQTHVKNIAAHMIFLAGVSPVFMGMFYGPLKETQEIVDVKDISPEAFDNMIKHSFYLSQTPQTCLCKNFLSGVNFFQNE